MKILKEGKLPESAKPWAREVTCGLGGDTRGCGSTLLIEADDLFRVRKSDGCSSWEHIAFECAFCRAVNKLEDGAYGGAKSKLPYRKQWRESRQNPPKGRWL